MLILMSIPPGGDEAGFGLIVTMKLSLPVFPALSVAVHVTVVTPTKTLEPYERLHVGVIAPSTSSIAWTSYPNTA